MKKAVALITGASSGIGRELAKIFSEKGYDLILVARDQAGLESLAKELSNSKSLIVPMDLSTDTAAQELFDKVKKQSWDVEVLVNNAGFGDFGFFHETKWEKESMMINLNVKTLTSLTKLFGKEMVKRRSGKILNLASTASFQPGPLMAVYYATKHFVLAFSEAIANEWREYNIVVTALCPGATQSNFQAASAMEQSKLVRNKKLPTAKQVAEFGYQALMQGKTVAVHGLRNRVLALSVRFFPRTWVTAIVRGMSEKS